MNDIETGWQVSRTLLIPLNISCKRHSKKKASLSLAGISLIIHEKKDLCVRINLFAAFCFGQQSSINLRFKTGCPPEDDLPGEIVNRAD